MLELEALPLPLVLQALDEPLPLVLLVLLEPSPLVLLDPFSIFDFDEDEEPQSLEELGLSRFKTTHPRCPVGTTRQGKQARQAG